MNHLRETLHRVAHAGGDDDDGHDEIHDDDHDDYHDDGWGDGSGDDGVVNLEELEPPLSQ